MLTPTLIFHYPLSIPILHDKSHTPVWNFIASNYSLMYLFNPIQRMPGRLFLLYFFFCSISFSCDQDQSEYTLYIDIFNKSSHSIQIEKILPLDNSENAMFGEADILIEWDDHIYIFDRKIRNTVIAFDTSGNYLNELAKGDGPDEINRLYSISLDRHREELLVITTGQNIYKLNKDLSIRSNVSSQKFIRCIESLDNGFLNFYHTNEGEGAYSYQILDEHFNVIHQMLPLYRPKHSLFTMNNPINRQPYETVFMRPLDFNVYRLNGLETEVKFTLDFGHFQFKESEYKLHDLQLIPTLMNAGERVLLHENVIHQEKYFAVSFVYNKEVFYFIYDLDNQETFSSVGQNVLPRGALKTMFDEDTFILVVHPEDWIEYYGKHPEESFPNVRSTDNIVLVYFNINS